MERPENYEFKQIKNLIHSLNTKVRILEEKVRNLDIKKMSESQIENTSFNFEKNQVFEEDAKVKQLSFEILDNEPSAQDNPVLFFMDRKLVLAIGNNYYEVQLNPLNVK